MLDVLYADAGTCVLAGSRNWTLEHLSVDTEFVSAREFSAKGKTIGAYIDFMELIIAQRVVKCLASISDETGRNHTFALPIMGIYQKLGKTHVTRLPGE